MTEEGLEYVGQWKNGTQHGLGTFTWTKENISYRGEWQAGLRHGSGVYEAPDFIHSGVWLFGKREGLGIPSSIFLFVDVLSCHYAKVRWC